MNWQKGCPVFRVLRKSYPWGLLVAIALKILCSQGLQRSRAQVRFWVTLSKANIAGAIELINELLVPEVWY